MSYSSINNDSHQSSVVLENVDDYLAPSQACVNPLFQPPSSVKKDDNVNNVEHSSQNPTPAESGDNMVATVIPRRRRRVVRPSASTETTTNTLGSVPESSLSSPSSTQPPIKGTKEAIKATIADCLACSGCVTTAETVLLEQHHSLTSLRKRLEIDENQGDQDGTSSQRRQRRRAITLSPNSIADLSRHWDLSTDRLPAFATLLHTVLGANLIIDGNLPLEWSWQEEAQEFVDHYRQTRLLGSLDKPPDSKGETSNASPPPSIAIDATRTLYYLPDGTTKIVTHSILATTTTTTTTTTTVSKDDSNTYIRGTDAEPQQREQNYRYPLISASCPALVCLVEKSLHSLVPNLSQSLSPMSRMGWELSQQQQRQQQQDQQKDMSDWDHWAIMPCHDKKLEASRKDFEINMTGQTDKKAVDLVITTMELVELLEEWLLQKSAVHQGAITFTGSMKDYLGTLSLTPTWTSTITGNAWSMTRLEQELTKLPVLYLSSGSVHRPPPSSSSIIMTSAGEPSQDQQPSLAYHSGGHADFIFRYAARELFQVDIPHVQWKSSGGTNHNNKNNNNNNGTIIKSVRLANLQKKQQSYYACLYQTADESSYTQEESFKNHPAHNPNSDPKRLVMKFGMVRGMQTMQRALNDLDPSLDYLEAMACPHGCVNGGGSVRTTHVNNNNNNNNNGGSGSTVVRVKETPTETKARVDQTVDRLMVPTKEPSTFEGTRYQTHYHVVPPMQHTMGAAAGVKVNDMQW